MISPGLNLCQLRQAMITPLDCDEVMRAAALRKSELLGEVSAPIERGRYNAPSAADAARDVPGWNDPLPAGPDEVVAEDVPGWNDPLPDYRRFCAVQSIDGALCTRTEGHDGDHAARGTHSRWPQLEAAR